MSTEQNKELVLHWKDEIWNKRNLSIINKLYAPDYVGHIVGAPGPVQGPEALKQQVGAYFAAFEVQWATEFLVAEGDKVVAYDTFGFKHTGTFQGIPPTGKEATLTSIDIYRIVDGKIVEQWVEANLLSLMQQLGIIPAPGH
jgi:predicted ester cyclase